MAVDSKVLLRLTEEYVTKILDQLDRDQASAAANARKSERHTYRAKVIVEWIVNDGAHRAAVATRNLSRHGLGFLTTRFVYPGTRCRVRLISALNIAQVSEATVMRCRYLSGTTGVHEVGVKFDQPIDVSIFQPSACVPRVLLAGFDETRANMISLLLRRLQTQVEVQENIDEAQRLATEQPFDLLVFDADATQSPCDLIRRMREEGYFRRVMSLSLTEKSKALIAQKCCEDKCRACDLGRMNAEDMLPQVDAVRIEPVVSDLAADASMRPLINQMVCSLRTIAEGVEEAHRAKDDEKLARLLTQLCVSAETTGFESIAEACRALMPNEKLIECQVERRNLLASLAQRCLGARLAGGG